MWPPVERSTVHLYHLAIAIVSTSRIGFMVKGPALSTVGCRFDPGSWKLVKVNGGICSTWMTSSMEKLSGGMLPLSLRLVVLFKTYLIFRGVSENWVIQWKCSWENAELSSIVPKLCFKAWPFLKGFFWLDSSKNFPISIRNPNFDHLKASNLEE